MPAGRCSQLRELNPSFRTAAADHYSGTILGIRRIETADRPLTAARNQTTPSLSQGKTERESQRQPVKRTGGDRGTMRLRLRAAKGNPNKLLKSLGGAANTAPARHEDDREYQPTTTARGV